MQHGFQRALDLCVVLIQILDQDLQMLPLGVQTFLVFLAFLPIFTGGLKGSEVAQVRL